MSADMYGPNTPQEIHVDGSREVALILDGEGADYIARVMRAEFERTADAGAFNIARCIEEAR